ncbi:urease accessory protein UreD [Phenylobacterium sp.]|uniref:urease accessory protein UreD n=1 Tax=Phenylobacterium sp. TaxID=1871053 RepID=UPI0025CFFF91|nr:urease accessory protein UreD [Phenylobacterium sp.]MBX3484645.1 urease accessory protein UreD [Phenylobacterium sp.]
MIQGPASLPQLPVLQRARGAGRIVVRAEDGRTRLSRLYQDGCGKIRLPRGGGVEAVLINSSGGLTGGDRMDWAAEAGAGATLTLTTQACEKVYRARDGVAEVRTDLTVGEAAELHWLPQETILFDEGALSRRLEADLAEGARLLAVEAVVLGRTAMDETVRRGVLHDRWRIRREGRLVFADDLRLDGPIAEAAAKAPVLAGMRAFASILLVDDDAGRFVAPLRAALGPLGGASAFDGKLFARVAAPDGFTLRRGLLPALEALRDGRPLPRVWRT